MRHRIVLLAATRCMPLIAIMPLTRTTAGLLDCMALISADEVVTIISGAFGVFRTDLARAVGGYRADAIGEDFEFVVRLHRRLLEENQDYRIEFVPDPVCWTEAPEDSRYLRRQSHGRGDRGRDAGRVSRTRLDGRARTPAVGR